MKWLTITDNTNEIKNVIKNIDQNFELIEFNLELQNLSINNDIYSELAGTIIFSFVNANTNENFTNAINSLTGYLLAQNIPIFTNISTLQNNSFLQCNNLICAESSEKLSEQLISNGPSLIENAKK